MPNKAAFKLSRPSVWSQNTSYVSVSGIHSENSPQIIAKCNNIEKQCSNVLSVMENMHKRDMHNLDKNKREMEQSMLAYSEKMRQINRQRRSLPVLPSLELAKYWSVGNKHEIEGSVSYERSKHFEDDESLRRTSSDSRVSIGNRQLSPIILRSNRKMTYHGNEGHYLDANAIIRPRVHSVSISNPSKKTEEKRQRKVCVTLPPSPESYRKLRETCESVDSAYESHDFSGVDSDSDDSNLHSDYHIRTCVQISPFPDIIEESPPVFKDLNNKSTLDKIEEKRKRPKKTRRTRKSTSDLPELHPHRKLLPLRKSPINSHRKFSYPGPRKQSLASEEKKVLEKKGPAICQSFRYSSAMEELLKSPNPFSVSKNGTVSKLEKGPDGRMVSTLGAEVLTVIGIDDMENIRGIKVKLDRHTLPNSSRDAISVSRDNLTISKATLPSTDNKGALENDHALIESTNTISNSVNKEIVSDSKSNVFFNSVDELPLPNLAQQSASTVTLVSVEG